ncbi:hypothetical protein BIW12_04200 [Flavobacterium commune]|uniref:Uncharacterized protein n=2 Tax=Flavobacterium commune TaxID=1306519 RepID=A0A1D9P7Z5_9FLAO|nr:hypothetical protein [uncultured Flavobacterium sp.]AOZ98701.1 hypothetical protein BIW12_04200 [Flavobacterium commune]
MSTKRMITRALELIRNIRSTNIEKKENRVELTNARFGINLDPNFKDQKKVANSLTFMMYSKENETLFI